MNGSQASTSSDPKEREELLDVLVQTPVPDAGIASAPSLNAPVPDIQNEDPMKTLAWLMPDWNNPELTTETQYGLVLKFSECNDSSKKNIFKKLFDIMNKHQVYNDVILRIIYQFFYELELEEQKFKTEEVMNRLSRIKIVMPSPELIENAKSLEDHEYRFKVIQILIVFLNVKADTLKRIKAALNEKKELTVEQNAFLDLASHLKNHQSIDFHFDLNKFLNEMKNNYGDYLSIFMKPDARLLYKIADNEKLLNAQSVIFQKFPNIESNSTIMKTFLEVQDLRTFNIHPFKREVVKELEDKLKAKSFDSFLQKLGKALSSSQIKTKDMKELKKFIFGRRIDESSEEALDKTLFERILSSKTRNLENTIPTYGISDIIKLIWKVFDLASREEILTLKNPAGKVLMDYVIESKDDQNLLTFLMPIQLENEQLIDKSYYLIMLNKQFETIKAKTKPRNDDHPEEQNLFDEYQLLLSRHGTNENFSNEFFIIIFALLEEKRQITDIAKDVPIDRLLTKACDKNWAKKKLYPNKKGVSDQDSLLARFEYFIHNLLGHIVAYWTAEDKNFENYKYKFLKRSEDSNESLGPFFSMLFMILRGNENNFVDKFEENLRKLGEFCRERYNSSEAVCTTNFLFVLLLCAMLNDKKLICDCILDFDNFDTVDMKFPSNMRANQTTKHVTKKLLERGYQLKAKSNDKCRDKEIPRSWINSEMLEEFLDSRVRYENEDYISVDTSFLLHTETRKMQVKSAEDVSDKLIFHEDTETLKFLMENEELKPLIDHPVIATYINLKSLKYQRLDWYNLMFFICGFILPFALLIIASLNEYSEHCLFIVMTSVCFLVTFLLTIRELLQFFLIYDGTVKNYFHVWTNRFEFSLILISIATVFVTFANLTLMFIYNFLIWIIVFLLCPLVYDETWRKILTAKNYKTALKFGLFLACLGFFLYFYVTEAKTIYVVFVLLTTLVLLPMFPYDPYIVNVIILETVAKTFLGVFFKIIVILLTSFTFCFYIIYGFSSPAFEKVGKKNATASSRIDEEEDPLDNFKELSTNAMKVLMMLSGEYGIEPNKLGGFINIVLFIVFVLSTYVIFNWILGLAMDDVSELRKQSTLLILERKLTKFIATSDEVFLHLYKLSFTLDNGYLTNVFSILRHLANENKYLHKIDKVYVNVKTKEMTVRVDKKHLKVGSPLSNEEFRLLREVSPDKAAEDR